ncbi:hypothetical protein CLF_100074 [Clonorchis sinensis]|uniref:Uncharacterized protein n=1 Tax=Clonorchis sinensis TaxID=79923 RepID=G7Y2M7_CLOSI|nr:hypothetical protein CLF_100074 [Clonorchis sinensis]
MVNYAQTVRLGMVVVVPSSRRVLESVGSPVMDRVGEKVQSDTGLAVTIRSEASDAKICRPSTNSIAFTEYTVTFIHIVIQYERLNLFCSSSWRCFNLWLLFCREASILRVVLWIKYAELPTVNPALYRSQSYGFCCIGSIVVFEDKVSVFTSDISPSRSMVRQSAYMLTAEMLFMSTSNHVLRQLRSYTMGLCGPPSRTSASLTTQTVRTHPYTPPPGKVLAISRLELHCIGPSERPCFDERYSIDAYIISNRTYTSQTLKKVTDRREPLTYFAPLPCSATFVENFKMQTLERIGKYVVATQTLDILYTQHREIHSSTGHEKRAFNFLPTLRWRPGIRGVSRPVHQEQPWAPKCNGLNSFHWTTIRYRKSLIIKQDQLLRLVPCLGLELGPYHSNDYTNVFVHTNVRRYFRNPKVLTVELAPVGSVLDGMKHCVKKGGTFTQTGQSHEEETVASFEGFERYKPKERGGMDEIRWRNFLIGNATESTADLSATNGGETSCTRTKRSTCVKLLPPIELANDKGAKVNITSRPPLEYANQVVQKGRKTDATIIERVQQADMIIDAGLYSVDYEALLEVLVLFFLSIMFFRRDPSYLGEKYVTYTISVRRSMTIPQTGNFKSDVRVISGLFLQRLAHSRDPQSVEPQKAHIIAKGLSPCTPNAFGSKKSDTGFMNSEAQETHHHYEGHWRRMKHQLVSNYDTIYCKLRHKKHYKYNLSKPTLFGDQKLVKFIIWIQRKCDTTSDQVPRKRLTLIISNVCTEQQVNGIAHKLLSSSSRRKDRQFLSSYELFSNTRNRCQGILVFIKTKVIRGNYRWIFGLIGQRYLQLGRNALNSKSNMWSGSTPAIVLPSGGMAARHRKDVTAEQKGKQIPEMCSKMSTAVVLQQYQISQDKRYKSISKLDKQIHGHVIDNQIVVNCFFILVERNRFGMAVGIDRIQQGFFGKIFLEMSELYKCASETDVYDGNIDSSCSNCDHRKTGQCGVYSQVLEAMARFGGLKFGKMRTDGERFDERWPMTAKFSHLCQCHQLLLQGNYECISPPKPLIIGSAYSSGPPPRKSCKGFGRKICAPAESSMHLKLNFQATTP